MTEKQIAPNDTPAQPEEGLRVQTEKLLDDLGLQSDDDGSPPAAAPVVSDTTRPIEEPAQAQAAPQPQPQRDERGRFKPTREQQAAQAAQQTEQPAGEQPEPEIDWRARAQQLEQDLARSRTGFQSTIRELRQGLRQTPYVEQPQQPHGMQPMPQQLHGQPQVDRLPIEFDEQGRPFVPAAALAPVLQQMVPRQAPPDPATLRRVALGRIQQDLINRDPVNNAPAVNRVFSAMEMADHLVLAKQQELGGFEFRSPEQLVDFMENTGITEVLRQQYPDLITDSADIETMVEGTLGVNARKLERLVSKARGGAAPVGNRQPVVQQQQQPAGNVAHLRPLPASKPRSQAARGAPEPVASAATRMEYLESKNPLDWTAEEAREFEKLTKQGVSRAG